MLELCRRHRAVPRAGQQREHQHGAIATVYIRSRRHLPDYMPHLLDGRDRTDATVMKRNFTGDGRSKAGKTCFALMGSGSIALPSAATDFFGGPHAFD